jgi:hypothetical protein
MMSDPFAFRFHRYDLPFPLTDSLTKFAELHCLLLVREYAIEGKKKVPLQLQSIPISPRKDTGFVDEAERELVHN